MKNFNLSDNFSTPNWLKIKRQKKTNKKNS